MNSYGYFSFWIHYSVSSGAKKLAIFGLLKEGEALLFHLDELYIFLQADKFGCLQYRYTTTYIHHSLS